MKRRCAAGAALALALLCAGSAPAAETLIDRWGGLVAEASRRFEIPEDWIRSVMRVESAGRPELHGRPIVSSAGAMGLMQLMPGTWSAMRDRYGLGGDPFNPHDNIFAGAAYLRELYGRFGFPGLFAAYNAGPGRFEAYRDAGRALPGETRSYLAALSAAPAIWPSAPPHGGGLFFTLGRPPQPPAVETGGNLFIVLKAF